jgi:hypothetical protein
MQRLQFLLAFILPPAAIYSFRYDGWHCMVALLIIFVVFPVLELVLPLDSANLDEKMTADEKNAVFYDWLLYAAIPVYIVTFIYFFAVIDNTTFGTLEFWSRVSTMGLIGAIFGFNIGHELSHRNTKTVAYFWGQLLLLSVLNCILFPITTQGIIATSANLRTLQRQQKENGSIPFGLGLNWEGISKHGKSKINALNTKGMLCFPYTIVWSDALVLRDEPKAERSLLNLYILSIFNFFSL